MLLLALAACDGTTTPDATTQIWKMLPFDGAWTWVYVSTDTTLPHKLVATSIETPEVIDGSNVYTVSYAKECVGSDPACVDGEVLRTIRWSSDTQQGVRIHGFGVDGATVELSPPIQVVEADAQLDEPIETTTGGATWSGAWVAVEDCPLSMSVEWTCHVLEISAGAGAYGYPVAGTWWVTTGHGVAAMEIATETGRWELESDDCVGDCNGQW